MGGQKRGKLNWLQHHLPDGLVADAGWLERQGYSRGLRNKYVTHGWLDQLGHGVFRRPRVKSPTLAEDGSLRWQNVVVSLQTLLRYPLAVGGRTALELQGFAHYLNAAGPREVHLYGVRRLPGWVSKLKLDTRLTVHNAGKLFKAEALAGGIQSEHVAADSGNSDSILGSLRWQAVELQEWPVLMSSPERAILELLDEVPRRETFHQADVLMEGLQNLSPRRLQKLLVACRNVKVKRLFFLFAERHNHAWLKKLDRSGIDFGRGKRMLVRGGKLDTKYNITVPKSLDGGL
jgi:hypothetical protein